MSFLKKEPRNEPVRKSAVAERVSSGALSFPARFVQKMSKDEDPVQGKFNSIQRKSSENGLPDDLKSGVEKLSGISLADVKVHYNSSKPAQLNALAYAQGSDIHIAPVRKGISPMKHGIPFSKNREGLNRLSSCKKVFR